MDGSPDLRDRPAVVAIPEGADLNGAICELHLYQEDEDAYVTAEVRIPARQPECM